MRVVAAPASPFKGLAAFEDSELDALFFFGREREREVVVANLLASRLTILYGESGVGKSSLLAAGVMRALREVAPQTVISLRSTWSGAIDDVLDEVRNVGESYLILDQFEEYFVYHSADEDEPGTLLHDLPELLRDSRVNVLIALREDSLARLDAFKARIPSVFANQVRLEHLDREAGRAAILGPVARWNELTGDAVVVEPALVEAVLDEVSAGKVDGMGGDRGRIEAPYLQLVLERIWDAERARGSATLRLSTLRELGGATSIVREHLQRALDALDAGERDVAASVFEHLVTPSGTKIAHRSTDLAEYADVPVDDLHRVLAQLTGERIVHSVDGSDRYEIFHDVLAEPIRAWRERRRLDEERSKVRRRQRRLYLFSAATLVALAIVAGLAVWAFSERGSARAQARHARAGQLEAQALQQLALDPSTSVRLALAAARLEPGLGSETVLRQTLVSDRVRLRVRVGEPVRAVAISPTAHLLAAALPHGKILVIDLQTRRVLHTLHVAGGVGALRFHDQAVLVATSSTGVLDAWTLGAGRREFATSRLHGALVRAAPHIREIVRAPGLVAAAVAERGGRVRARIFDSAGRLLHVLPEIGITDLDFSPDGKLLATASADGLTTIWRTSTGGRVFRLFDAPSGVTKVAFSPDGTLLASGGTDSGVRVWNVATGLRLFFFVEHQNAISSLGWSPDSRLLASGSKDRNVSLWAIKGLSESGSRLALLAGHNDTVTSVAFSADGRQLVTGSDDGTARVWDARPEEELRVLGRATGPMIGARWAGNTIVAASADGTVQIYDAPTRRRLLVLHGPEGAALTSFAVSGDGSIVAAGASNGTTTVWSGRTGKRLSVTRGGASGRLLVAVSARGDLAASADQSGLVRLWSARTGKPRWSATSAGNVTDLEFSPDGTRMLAASTSGVVVWSSSGRRPLYRFAFKTGAARAEFSPDGTLIGAADRDGTARVWRTKTGNLYRLFRSHPAALTDLAFSFDNVFLATSSTDADGRIWNIKTGRRGILRGHSATVAAIAFSPNRRWIATAGPVSAGLWPVSTGRILFFLRGNKGRLTGISFSPDGHTILSTSEDGTVRTYACEVCLSLDALIRLAEGRLARGG